MYIEKAKAILEDPDGYEKLKKDPTKQLEKAMTQLWRNVATDKIPETNAYVDPQTVDVLNGMNSQKTTSLLYR